MNCCVSPFATDAFAGVTAIDTSACGPTVRVVEPEIAPNVAEIDVGPEARLVAWPPVWIVATPEFADAQVTELVRSAVRLSV